MTSIKANVVACRQCNRLFQTWVDTNICMECRKKEDEKFKVVRTFIRNHKLAGLLEASEACNIPTKKILEWVREERLCFTEESDITIPCMHCGTQILTGKYCNACKTKMVKNLKSAYTSDHAHDENGHTKSKDVNRMHFLNKHKK